MNETATEKHDKIVCQIARNYDKFLSSFSLYNKSLGLSGRASLCLGQGVVLCAVSKEDKPEDLKWNQHWPETKLFLEKRLGKGSLDIFIQDAVFKKDNDEIGQELNIVVEVKSHIKSITETIRQINGHKLNLKGNYLYIVASPDNRYIDILESQDILFYDASLCEDW